MRDEVRRMVAVKRMLMVRIRIRMWPERQKT
jgi:hypothetical protein